MARARAFLQKLVAWMAALSRIRHDGGDAELREMLRMVAQVREEQEAFIHDNRAGDRVARHLYRLWETAKAHARARYEPLPSLPARATADGLWACAALCARTGRSSVHDWRPGSVARATAAP